MIVSEPRLRRCLAISLLALAFVTTLPARAQISTAKEQAKDREGKRAAQEHLTRGNDLFTHDRYADALEQFQAAFAAFPSPKLQFNLGQCERALGHDDAAIDHFQRFLYEAKDVPPALRAEAERYLAETRAHASTAAMPIAAPPIVAPSPVPAPPLPVAPAPSVVAPAVEITNPAPIAAPHHRPLRSRWWFWTAVGVVALGA
ncbi:MAG TPA: tetratricopeptide repeat protein, partial [Polyangia bacterium]|nr:tetratricopeptide repeat protein [Polyangia bacterium]